MTAIRDLLTRSLTTPEADATASSLAAYFVGILVCACGFVAIGFLEATTAQTFLTVLGVLSVSMLFVLLGQLIEIHERLRKLATNNQ